MPDLSSLGLGLLFPPGTRWGAVPPTSLHSPALDEVVNAVSIPQPQTAEREGKEGGRANSSSPLRTCQSPCLEPWAPETTSLERPGGHLEPQPPAGPSWAGRVLLCSSPRQPNGLIKGPAQGRTPRPTAHSGTELRLRPWLLMPIGPAGPNVGFRQGGGRHREGGGAELRKVT